MAELSADTIQDLARLSRIHVEAAEADKLVEELGRIFDYVEQLGEIDTEGVKACNQVIEGVSNVMREDEVGETLPREVLLANAPDQVAGMIRVPPIMRRQES